LSCLLLFLRRKCSELAVSGALTARVAPARQIETFSPLVARDPEARPAPFDR